MSKKHKEIPLVNPFLNGSLGERIHPDGQKFMDIINEIGKLQKKGEPIYIKILSGERKGSIVKFISNEFLHAFVRQQYGYHYCDRRTHYEVEGKSGHFVWEDRRNKIQAYLSFYESYAWLKDYEGPTVYKRLDKKKIIKETIKSKSQKDIDGNDLKIGDKVLYCNIRYGGGTVLCKGTVKEFKGKVVVYHSDKRTHIYTIILNEDGKEESKIESSHLMIKKFRW
jgi:hypothetical protein